jgi:hypothetical protein
VGRRLATGIAAAAAVATLAACGGEDRASPSVAKAPLTIRTLRAHVVRVGTIRGEALYGLQLRAFVCSRSSAEANDTVPTSFRIAHYVVPRKALTGWKQPFRVLDNDLHWLVTLGETRAARCGDVDFEDVIEPRNHAGLESDLGVLGYSTTLHCYGVQLTLRAVLGRKPVAATKRAIVQCGRFVPR